MSGRKEGGKAGRQAPPSSPALVSPEPALLPRPLSVLGHLPRHICLLKALKSSPRGNQFVFAPPSVWDFSLFFFFSGLGKAARSPGAGGKRPVSFLPSPPVPRGLLSSGPAASSSRTGQVGAGQASGWSREARGRPAPGRAWPPGTHLRPGGSCRVEARGVCPAAQADGGAETSLWGAGQAGCKVRAEPTGLPWPQPPARCHSYNKDLVPTYHTRPM